MRRKLSFFLQGWPTFLDFLINTFADGSRARTAAAEADFARGAQLRRQRADEGPAVDDDEPQLARRLLELLRDGSAERTGPREEGCDGSV